MKKFSSDCLEGDLDGELVAVVDGLEVGADEAGADEDDVDDILDIDNIGAVS